MHVQPFQDNTFIPFPGASADVAAKAIVASAEAGLADGLGQGDAVTLRSSFNKDLKTSAPPKKSGGGLFGFLKSIVKPLSSILSFIPGLGTVGSMILNFATEAISQIGNVVQGGKVKLGDIGKSVLSAVTSAIPGLGALGAVGNGLGGLVQGIANGKLDVGTLTQTIGGFLEGTPLANLPKFGREVIDRGIATVGEAIRNGDFNPHDLLRHLGPITDPAAGPLNTGRQIVEAAGDAVDAGLTTADHVGRALQPFIDRIQDPTAREFLRELLSATTDAVRDGHLSANDVIMVVNRGLRQLGQ